MRSTASGNSRVQIISDTTFDAASGTFTLSAVFNGDGDNYPDLIYRSPTNHGTWVGFVNDGSYYNVPGETRAFGIMFGGTGASNSGVMRIAYNDGSEGRSGNVALQLPSFGEATHAQLRSGFSVDLIIDNQGWSASVTVGLNLTDLGQTQETFTTSGNWADIEIDVTDLGQLARIDAHYQCKPSSSMGGAVLDIASIELSSGSTVDPTPASSFIPADGDQMRDLPVEMSWLQGLMAVSYDVYIGTNLNDVNNADTSSELLVSQDQPETVYAAALNRDTVYYWRVDTDYDTGTATGTIKGQVMNFSVMSEDELPDDLSIVGWWKMDDPAGAWDSSGYNRHGTLIGDANIVETVDGPALYLDGSGDGAEETYTKIGSKANGTGLYYDGMMDDLRIYSRALSDGEILTLAGGTETIIIPVDEEYNLSDKGIAGEEIINAKVFSVLADQWLDEVLWP